MFGRSVVGCGHKPPGTILCPSVLVKGSRQGGASVSSRWSEFIELTRDSPPREQTVRAADLVQRKRRAIDIGAGALNETRFLLTAGFREVVALDREQLDKRAAQGLPRDRFTYIRLAFESYEFPDQAFDLVNAQYSLPFIRPAHFNRVFAAIRRSVAPGGIFAGQLFGDRDEWMGDPTTTFRSRIAALSLFDSMEVIEFNEEEVDDETADGVPKHWHVFHVIARRPQNEVERERAGRYPQQV